MLDRCRDRQDSSFANEKYAIIDSMCYAEFLRYNYLAQIRVSENVYLQHEVTDQLIQGSHPFQHNYPQVMPLLARKEKFECRKIPSVLQ